MWRNRRCLLTSEVSRVMGRESIQLMTRASAVLATVRWPRSNLVFLGTVRKAFGTPPVVPRQVLEGMQMASCHR